jgi:hypothetical protein
MNKTNQTSVTILCAISLLLGACSQQATRPAADSAEAIVEQRAKERWNLILQKQYMDAYEYLTPGYRATTPIDIYSVSMRRSAVRWQTVEFKTVECQSESVCRATFDVDAKVVGQLRGVDSVPVSKDVQDEWLLVDGQWYYVMP